MLSDTNFWQSLDDGILKATSSVVLMCDFHSSGVAFFETNSLIPFFDKIVKRLPTPKVVDYFKKYCQKNDLNQAADWLEEFEKTVVVPEAVPSKNIFDGKSKIEPENPAKNETESKGEQESKIFQQQNPNPQFRKEMFFTKYIVEERICTSSQPHKQSGNKPRPKPSAEKNSSAKFRRTPYPSTNKSPKSKGDSSDDELPKVTFNRRRTSNNRVIKPTQIKMINQIKRPPKLDNIIDPRKVGVKDLNRLFLNPNDYSLDEVDENILDELSRHDSLNDKKGNSRNGLSHQDNTRSMDFDIFNGSQIQKRTPSRRDYMM
jgi:hypothetical protein